MPKVDRAKPSEWFHPPAGHDLKKPPKHASPQVPAPRLLPCDFRVEVSADSLTPTTALQHALRRHRLLFLWYAYPVHIHVPRDLTPGKESLYEELGLARPALTNVRPADDVFEYSEEIEKWLSEQRYALGTGPKGKPLRDVSDDWPAPYFANWAFEQTQVTPLDASYREVARLVGVALRKPKSDWIAENDVRLIRQCENVARPLVADDTGTTWNDRPIVWWHYPETLFDQVAVLDSLVLIEVGGRPNVATAVATVSPTLPTCSVALQGRGLPPVIRGTLMPILGDARYTVIEALVKAGPEGLSKDQLEGKINTAARKTLKAVHDSDERWAKVILLPQSSGMRYRLVHE